MSTHEEHDGSNGSSMWNDSNQRLVQQQGQQDQGESGVAKEEARVLSSLFYKRRGGTRLDTQMANFFQEVDGNVFSLLAWYVVVFVTACEAVLTVVAFVAQGARPRELEYVPAFLPSFLPSVLPSFLPFCLPSFRPSGRAFLPSSAFFVHLFLPLPSPYFLFFISLSLFLPLFLPLLYGFYPPFLGISLSFLPPFRPSFLPSVPFLPGCTKSGPLPRKLHGVC
jgi:hypothetical protein